MDRSSHNNGGWRFACTDEAASPTWQQSPPEDQQGDIPGPSPEPFNPDSPREHWAFNALELFDGTRLWAHAAAESAVLFINGEEHRPTKRYGRIAEFFLEGMKGGISNLAIRLQGADANDNRIGFFDLPLLRLPAEKGIADLYIQPDLRRNRITVSAAAPNGATLRHTIMETGDTAEGAPNKTIVEFPKYDPWPGKKVAYTLRSECVVDGNICDSCDTTFAMREATIREGRFFVNGRPLPLRVADYDPAIALTASNDPQSAVQKDIALASDAGFNALRLAWDACTSDVLDSTLNLGMVVFVDYEFGVPVEVIAERTRNLRNHGAIVAWTLQCASADGDKTHEDEWASDTLHRLHAVDPSRTAFAVAATGNSLMWRPYRNEAEPCRFVAPNACAPITPDTEQSLHALNLSIPYFLAPLSIGAQSDAGDAMSGNAWTDAPRDWADATQKAQAEAVGRVLRAARGNTAAAGYIYAPLRDDENSRAGLIDPTGKAKSAMAAAKAAQAPLALALRGKETTLAPREEMPLTLHLLSDSRTEEQAQLSLQVVGPTGQVLWKKMRAMRIGKSRRPLWDGQVAGSGKTGVHTFVARLKIGGRIVAEASYPFAVIEHPEKSAVRVGLIDPEGKFRAAVSKVCKLVTEQAEVHVLPPLANTIRAYPADLVAHALGQVRAGGALIVFDPPEDWNDLAPRIEELVALRRRPQTVSEDGVVGIASLHPVFDGLPTKCLLGSAHASLCGDRLFDGPTEDSVQVYAAPGSAGDLTQAHGIVVRRFGSGRITFVSAPVLHEISHDPAAERYLVNLVSYAARLSVPPAEEARPLPGAVEWLAESFEELSRWRVRRATQREISGDPLTQCPAVQSDSDSMAAKSWYLRPEGGAIDIGACLEGLHKEEIVYIEARAVLDRRVAAKMHLRYPGEVTLWVNDRIAELGDAEGAERQATLNLNAGRNRICIAFRLTPPDTAPGIRVSTDDGFPLRGVHWR